MALVARGRAANYQGSVAWTALLFPLVGSNGTCVFCFSGGEVWFEKCASAGV